MGRSKPKGPDTLRSNEVIHEIQQNAEIRIAPPNKDSKAAFPWSVKIAMERGTATVEHIRDVIAKIETIIKPALNAKEKPESAELLFWRNQMRNSAFFEKVDKIFRYLFDEARNPTVGTTLNRCVTIVHKEKLGEKIEKPVVITDSHANDPVILAGVLEQEHTDIDQVGVVVLDRHLDLIAVGGVEDIDSRASAVKAFMHHGIRKVAIVGTTKNDKVTESKESALRIREELRAELLILAKKLTGKHFNDADEIVDLHRRAVASVRSNNGFPEGSEWLANKYLSQLMGAYMNITELCDKRLDVYQLRDDFSPKNTARRVLDNFQKDGISCVTLSIDFDVLNLWNEEITTTMYSPFGLLGFLANVNPQALEGAIQYLYDAKRIEHISQNSRDFLAAIVTSLHSNERRDLVYPGYAEALAAAFFREYPHLSQFPSTPKDHVTDFTGMSLAHLTEFIKELKQQANERGMQFGIERKNGGVFYGTLTEISTILPDYKGNTVKAINEVIKAIIK